MRKLFTLTLALLASFSLCWGTATNFHDFVAAGDTIIDLEGTGSTPSAKFTAVNNTDWASVSTSSKNATVKRIDPATGATASATSNTYGTKLGNSSSYNSIFKVTGVTSVSFFIGGGSSRIGYLDVEPNGESKIEDAAHTKALSTEVDVITYALVASKSYTLTLRASGDIFCYAVKFTVAAKCQSPANALVLNADKTSDIYEGDEITFSTTGGNGGAITIEGANSETITANKWIAVAGTHTFTASQAKNGDYCAQEAELVLTVASATPVTACSIEGPTAGYIGDELTYTATAANATAFAWYVDEALQEGETDAEFVYTGVKGNHSIYATATNAYTATPVASDPIDLTVTKLCGMLIKATHKKATTADIDPASVVGGTVDKNTQDGGKLGSNGHYFGVKLASGSFMAGDVVTVVASTLNGGNTATLFSDKGTHSLGSAAFDSESKTATITLTESTTWIYLYRVDGEVCNPTMGYISVTRSCEDSDDASVKSLTVNGVEVAKDAELNKFEYTVSTNYAEENVTVAFTIHPLATSDKEGNTFTIPTPSAGDTNGASFKVTAEDGTQVTYTVFITKAASLSDDATLKALSVEGYEISPAFDAETTAYTITKAYGAETPAVGKVTATPNDANANAEVVLAADVYTITVTAEDGETKEYYYITVNTADAKKDLLEASFSNGANGYILNGNIQVPYLAGTSEPTFTAARFWNADGEPTAEIVDGKLVVTGADAKTAQYTIEYVEVTPMEASYDLITFTEVPSYIFSVYGWASDKGVKFSKDVEEAGTKRVSEGRDRIYIALPAAKSVILTGGSAGARPIKVTVNGVVDSKVTSTPAKDATITISLNQSEANFIGIESNGNNGDAGFTKMQLVQSDPTALDNTADEIKAVKFIENGQLFIRRGEKVYTITGEEVK